MKQKAFYLNLLGILFIISFITYCFKPSSYNEFLKVTEEISTLSKHTLTLTETEIKKLNEAKTKRDELKNKIFYSNEVLWEYLFQLELILFIYILVSGSDSFIIKFFYNKLYLSYKYGE